MFFAVSLNNPPFALIQARRRLRLRKLTIDLLIAPCGTTIIINNLFAKQKTIYVD